MGDTGEREKVATEKTREAGRKGSYKIKVKEDEASEDEREEEMSKKCEEEEGEWEEKDGAE